MDTLPEEVMVEILKKMDYNDFLVTIENCEKMKAVTARNENTIYRHFLSRAFGYTNTFSYKHLYNFLHHSRDFTQYTGLVHIDPLLRDSYGRTLLHNIVYSNQFVLYDTINELTRFIPINTLDFEGETVLHHLATTRRSGLIKYLVELGVDINIQNYHQDTALDVSITQNNNSFTRLLLHYNPIISEKTLVNCLLYISEEDDDILARIINLSPSVINDRFINLFISKFGDANDQFAPRGVVYRIYSSLSLSNITNTMRYEIVSKLLILQNILDTFE